MKHAKIGDSSVSFRFSVEDVIAAVSNERALWTSFGTGSVLSLCRCSISGITDILGLTHTTTRMTHALQAAHSHYSRETYELDCVT